MPVYHKWCIFGISNLQSERHLHSWGSTACGFVSLCLAGSVQREPRGTGDTAKEAPTMAPLTSLQCCNHWSF